MILHDKIHHIPIEIHSGVTGVSMWSYWQIIGSGDGLALVQHQAITWINDDQSDQCSGLLCDWAWVS